MSVDADVVVVGGGPAGLSTALALLASEPGGRLLVLEQHEFPREKPCAGGLGRRADVALARLGVTVDVPSAPVSGFCIELDGARVSRHEPRGRLVGRVVRRLEFDARLAELSRARGVRLETGVKVTGVRAGEGDVVVETTRGAVRARFVVGADGVGSVVRRLVAPGAVRWRAQAVEVDTPMTDADVERSLLRFGVVQASAFSGYVWDFPTLVRGAPLMCRGVYRVLPEGEALGVDKLEPALTTLLEARGVAQGRFTRKRYAERGFSPFAPVAHARVMLVGEAAGVDPITGEGIAQALMGGLEAGAFLARALREGAATVSGWRRALLNSGVGRDLVVRHALATEFFGPRRAAHERSLLSAPDFVALASQFFGGWPVSKRLLGKVLLQGASNVAREARVLLSSWR